MIINQGMFDRAKPAGFDGVFDWDFLLPAFAGTKITPMDIDCMIERKGKFIAFETKAKGAVIPLGQSIALEQLALSGWVIIILFAKVAEDIDGWEVWHTFSGSLKKEQHSGDAVGLVSFVTNWFVWASNG